MYGLIARLTASALIVTGAVAFLIGYGPAVTTVQADVYGPLVTAAGFLPPPPGAQGEHRSGRVLVNGGAFNYSIGRSRLSVERVLTHYETQFTVLTPGSGRPISSAVRLADQGAGIVAGFRLNGRKPDAMLDLQRFANTRRLNDLAEFHMVSAYSQGGTVYIEFTPSNEVQLDRLLPQGTEDAPGEDLPFLRRPEGLQRLLTIEQGEESHRSRTLIYRSSANPDAMSQIADGLGRTGWLANPLGGQSTIAHYSRDGEECFLGRAGTGASSVLLLVHRTHAASRTTR